MKENDDRKNDRFYVMALEDIDSRTHYWYYNAAGKLDNTIAFTNNDFGKGRDNTTTMVNKWNSTAYGAQNSNDMWGLIQDEVAAGWFVPSKSEWSAFGAAFGITSSNYANTYGLSNVYWSSSQGTTGEAYIANFSRDLFSIYYVGLSYYVRLATTF